MVALIIFIIIFIIFFNYWKSNYQFQLNHITFFQGEVGSGKSSIMTNLAIKKRKSRILFNTFIYPIVKIFGVKKMNEEIYSTYPIYHKSILRGKYWSNVIDRDFFNWKYRIPNEKPIVVIDELEYLFPSENQKTDPIYRFGTAWIRHATDATIYAASQNLDGVNVEFRRRINNVYNLTNCKRCIFPFGIWFSRVQVMKAIVCENITNVVQDNLQTRESNWYRFKYPKKNFKSRYGKNLYKLTDEQIHTIAVNYQALLDKMGLKNGDKWRSIEYEFE